MPEFDELLEPLKNARTIRYIPGEGELKFRLSSNLTGMTIPLFLGSLILALPLLYWRAMWSWMGTQGFYAILPIMVISYFLLRLILTSGYRKFVRIIPDALVIERRLFGHVREQTIPFKDIVRVHWTIKTPKVYDVGLRFYGRQLVVTRRQGKEIFFGLGCSYEDLIALLHLIYRAAGFPK